MPVTQPWRRLAAAALLLALSACSQSASHPNGKPGAPLTDPVVAATVNGKPIYIDDVLAEAVVRGAIKEGEELDPSSPIFYQIMENLIETRLMANEAEARGLDRNPDVRHRLEAAKERILANVLNEHIAQTALKESVIERMYREQIGLLKQGREVRARHILFDTKEDALAAKRRLDAGELFERLAYELSKDRSTAPDGGDMGYFLPEAMPDGIREVVENTPVGKVGGPVQTEEGWHLIKVEEKRDAAPPSLEEMRPKIVNWLMFDEQRRVVDKLKANARIARITDQPGTVSAGLSPRPGLPAPATAPPTATQQAPPVTTAPPMAPPAQATVSTTPSAAPAPTASRRPADGATARVAQPPAITFTPPSATPSIAPATSTAPLPGERET